MEIINNFNNKPQNRLKNQITKIEDKKSMVGFINQYSFFEYRLLKLQEKLKLSSKNLKNLNNLFGNANNNILYSDYNKYEAQFKIVNNKTFTANNPFLTDIENAASNFTIEGTPIKLNKNRNLFTESNTSPKTNDIIIMNYDIKNLESVYSDFNFKEEELENNNLITGNFVNLYDYQNKMNYILNSYKKNSVKETNNTEAIDNKSNNNSAKIQSKKILNSNFPFFISKENLFKHDTPKKNNLDTKKDQKSESLFNVNNSNGKNKQITNNQFICNNVNFNNLKNLQEEEEFLKNKIKDLKSKMKYIESMGYISVI